jgi:hypothetical protein
MDYEVHALKTVPSLIYSAGIDDLRIRLPEMILYDSENHILQISDAGSKNLKSAYSEPTLDIKVLGARLGHWLARLHTITSSATVLPIIKEQFNNVAGKRIYRTNFNGLAASLEKFGYDPKLGEQMNKKYGALLETDEVCLAHGDFWPANVVVADSNPGHSSPELTIIDWGLTRIGNGATDVGQFIAESWILETFNDAPDWFGHRGLAKAFLTAYLAERSLNAEDWLRVAVQFGTLVAYLPSVVPYPPGSHQPTEMVRIGNEILQLVEAGNITVIKDSVMSLLFEKQSDLEENGPGAIS